MYSLGCSELGGRGCSFVSQGDTAEETKKSMLKHFKEVHPELIKNISAADMKIKMDKCIHDHNAGH